MTAARMRRRRRTWPLNVDRLCCRLCPSPTSARTRSNHSSRGPAHAGMLCEHYRRMTGTAEAHVLADGHEINSAVAFGDVCGPTSCCCVSMQIGAFVGAAAPAEPGRTGRNMPAFAMSTARPSAFSDAVLPPVLGPATAADATTCQHVNVFIIVYLRLPIFFGQTRP